MDGEALCLILYLLFILGLFVFMCCVDGGITSL